jgi:hypothetical protein
MGIAGAGGPSGAPSDLPRGAVIHTNKGDIWVKLFPDEVSAAACGAEWRPSEGAARRRLLAEGEGCPAGARLHGATLRGPQVPSRGPPAWCHVAWPAGGCPGLCDASGRLSSAGLSDLPPLCLLRAGTKTRLLRRACWLSS